MKQDPTLVSLDVLACPTCHTSLSLEQEGTSLVCSSCQKIYPVVNGIPQFIQVEELTGLNKRFSRLYDYFSWFYRAFSLAAFAYIGMSEEHARREVLDRLEPEGAPVLEVSIGPGVNLPCLVGRPDVGELFGLDISPGQLRTAQKYIRQKAWDVELQLGNAEALPYQDNMFGGVVHIGGINFFNDKKKAIEEMIRVARPGARILICDENEKGARAYERTLPGFKRQFKGIRETVTAPVALVPSDMQDVKVFDVWKGWMYCLDFRKPS